jgi:hydrogenase/urease accessory protein HupE
VEAIFFLLVAGSAHGHTVGVSKGTYRFVGSEVEAEIIFARPELVAAIPQLDANQDGLLTELEINAARTALDTTIVQPLLVRGPSVSCVGALKSATLTEQDGLSIRVGYRCPDGLQSVTLAVNFLSMLSHGHRHIVTVTTAGTERQFVVYAGHADFQLSAAGGDGPESQTTAGAIGWSLFLLGVEHILTGYDHLVFLLGLILVGQQLRPLLAVVTAFTVAHSLTLGLAVLGIWTPNPDIIEPAIALSILYVGIENWFVRDVHRRWLITFPFGLIHGFGFAGALQEISLSSEQIPLALASFNLGVEAGQLMVLAIVLPLVLWLRRHSWFVNVGVKGMSTGIAIAGGWWFVVRVL